MNKLVHIYIFIFLFILCASVRAADKKIELDSLYIDQDQLFINFQIKNLLDDKTIEGLQRGFTSQVTHQVRLWKTTKLVSSIAAEVNHVVIIYYDNWDKKYAIVSENEKRLTGNIERLHEQCSQVTNLELTQIANLDAQSKYYISIQSAFQPMSNEAYNELRDWVSKKPNNQGSANPKKSRGRFFGVLLDLMGFGDSSFNFKSRDFFIRNNSQIQFVN